MIAELHAIGAPGNHRARVTWRRGEYSALEGLYALGRVLDVLAAPYQPASQDPALLSWINGRPWWTGRIPDQGGLPIDAPPTSELKVAQRAWFVLLYRLLIGRDTGPRLPTLLLALGQERVRTLLGA